MQLLGFGCWINPSTLKEIIVIPITLFFQERQDLDARIAEIIKETDSFHSAYDPSQAPYDASDYSSPNKPKPVSSVETEPATTTQEEESDSEPVMDDDELHNLLGV